MDVGEGWGGEVWEVVAAVGDAGGGGGRGGGGRGRQFTHY